MGLKDVINNTKEDPVDIDAEDIEMDEHDWKWMLAHEPWIGYRIAASTDDKDVVRLMVKWLESLIKEGHPEMGIDKDMQIEISEQKQELEEYLESWD